MEDAKDVEDVEDAEESKESEDNTMTKIYLQNGTLAETFSPDTESMFYIRLDEFDGIRLLRHTADSLNPMVYDALTDLSELFTSRMFGNKMEYELRVPFLPPWTYGAGLYSDLSMSASSMEKEVSKIKDPVLYKALYLHDCHFLGEIVQNLSSSMEKAFVNYYIKLSGFQDQYGELRVVNDDGDLSVVAIASEESREISTLIETYFLKAYSILDTMSKICYEFQFMDPDMRGDITEYKGLKSAGISFADRSKLSLNGAEGTLFEDCELIQMIQTIRNEMIHTGVLEFCPNVFLKRRKKVPIERYMLFPDMKQGHLDQCMNRNHFYSERVKINDTLPGIHKEFQARLFITADRLKKEYKK